MNQPSLFIQQQIANLRVLANFFSAQTEAAPRGAPTPEMLLCRESMLTVSVLLPKLEAARQAFSQRESEDRLQQGARLCEGCDE